MNKETWNYNWTVLLDSEAHVLERSSNVVNPEDETKVVT